MLFDIFILLFPIDRASYTTNLSSQEALEKIQTIIQPVPNGYIHLTPENNFKNGYADLTLKNNFKIRRNISYRNDFHPSIKGYVESYGSGSRITLNMRPSIFILVLIPIFLIVMYVFAFEKFHFFIYSYLVVLGAFKYESFIAKKDFEELFGVKNNYL